MHHLSADAFPLKRTIYKELSNKKTIILHCALQPANVGTLDSDDADLRQRPLLAKTNRLSSPIQVQFLNDFLHSGEVQTFAIFEILSARGTKCDLHWLIRNTDDAGLQVTGWSLDFKLTHYQSEGLPSVQPGECDRVFATPCGSSFSAPVQPAPFWQSFSNVKDILSGAATVIPRAPGSFWASEARLR